MLDYSLFFCLFEPGIYYYLRQMKISDNNNTGYEKIDYLHVVLYLRYASTPRLLKFSQHGNIKLWNK